MATYVNSGFTQLSQANFVAQAGRIVTAMTGNANFPEPWPATVPSLARLQADLAALQGVVMATTAGDKTRTVERDQARNTMANDLTQLAFYVQNASQGDVGKLATTGFPLRQSPQRTQYPEVPPAPAQIALKRGPVSGTLVVNASRVSRAVSYEVQIATADPTVESSWSDVGTYTSSHRIQIPGLTAGKVYSVRMRAFGKAGYGPWATAESLMVV